MFERTVIIDNKRFRVVSDDLYLENIGKVFEPHMTELFKSLLSPVHSVVDVGANIGMTSILFGMLADKVISFEAVPSTYTIMCKNIQNAGLHNVTLLNLGLGDMAREACITFAANNRSGGFVSDHVRPERDHVTESVKIVRLDDVYAEYLQRVDFIKIDVEGFERQVIEGAREVLNKFRPTVVLELNHWCLNAFQRVAIPDFFDFLRSVFPVLLAVDTDIRDIKNLHDNDEAYGVMHEHIAKFRYPNIVASFDERNVARLRAS